MGSRDQRTPGDQIVTTYLHAFNVLALNGITQLHTSHRNHSVQVCFSLLLRPCKVHPLPASKTHCVPEYHHQLLQLFHMQHPQVCTNQCKEFRSIHTNAYTHKGSELEQVVAPLGHARNAYNEAGTRAPPPPPDHTHKQTPFACVRNYVIVYKAPVCRQMVVITGYYYHLSLIPYTGYSVQIPHLQFVHFMLAMKVFTHLPPPNLSQSHSVP